MHLYICIFFFLDAHVCIFFTGQISQISLVDLVNGRKSKLSSEVLPKRFFPSFLMIRLLVCARVFRMCLFGVSGLWQWHACEIQALYCIDYIFNMSSLRNLPALVITDHWIILVKTKWMIGRKYLDRIQCASTDHLITA